MTITYDLVRDAAGGITIVAASNLPDGTDLGASLGGGGIGYFGQDDGLLAGGKIAFGPFSDGGTPLPPGSYEMTIGSPIARVQSEEVQACIGEDGENLTGPLIATADVTDGGKRAELAVRVAIE